MEITLTNDNFKEKVLNSEIPVLVDFWAEWCGPCKMLGPELEKLAEEQDGKILVGKVNIDEQEDLAAEFRIMSIPTMLVLKNGQQVAKSVGYAPRADILDMINKA